MLRDFGPNLFPGLGNLEPGTASRAAYLYAALSRICHYHLYELAPTATELTRWLSETADLVELLRGLLPAP